MPRVSELFFKTAIVFLILGIAAGLQMAISGDHGAFPAHAHFNLLGWVTSAIFGGYYALNPAKAEKRLAMIHYGLYTLGLVVMLPPLYLKYAYAMDAVEPILGIGSLIVAAGVLVFAVMVFSSTETVRSTTAATAR
jgi:peptidoglycan/LPS O-acetylase OafA/YrhL